MEMLPSGLSSFTTRVPRYSSSLPARFQLCGRSTGEVPAGIEVGQPALTPSSPDSTRNDQSRFKSMRVAAPAVIASPQHPQDNSPSTKNARAFMVSDLVGRDD